MGKWEQMVTVASEEAVLVHASHIIIPLVGNITM
jgi:hypothetical protein